MVKIVSRKSLGKQPVYDFGVVKDHNFLLANGLVASNCFNKSHSTAYAYVTYQTAYLKANYPVEYMTALLTASSGNQEKIEKYRENCQRMGIEVEPPDINRSEEDFTPQGDRILFGLSAVKNLGQAAIDNILQARKAAEGRFKSLADFCDRVDLRVVNRRALETLIFCGAFDEIEANRRQLIHDIDLVIPWAQNRSKEREVGQMNLFDLLSNSTSTNNQSNNDREIFEHAPRATAVEDYPLQEKLKLEKENLGFYVSEHPLKSASQAAQILSPINLNQLSTQKSRQRISAVVMLTAVKIIITKKGTPMAFVQMEDITGEGEGVVFPDTYARIESLIVENARLIIWGKVEQREEQWQLIVEDAETIEQVKMIMLEITPQQALDRRLQNSLKSILQEQSGDRNRSKIPVIVTMGKGKQRQFIRLGQKFWVQDEQAAVTSLKQAGFFTYAQSLLLN
jgi:DNA polymerase-3 subunit alpha